MRTRRGPITFGVAPALAGLALLGIACGTPGAEGGDDDVIQVTSKLTYDSVAKPVPTSFIYLKTNSNKCCSGAGMKSTNCSTACADSKGLVTSAGVNKADDYYRATGQSSLDTFEKWKSFYGFPRRLPGETLAAYRARAKVVVYYNRTELGLGRELACATNGNGTGCYVTNYGDTFNSIHDLGAPDADGLSNGLGDAIRGTRPKNTVVISYDTRRESTAADGKAVQFSAFGGDGARLKKAQLDNMGARPIPQICMSCHGGVWDADASTNLGGNFFGISRFARFLPLVTSTVTWSGQSPYTLPEQEDAIRVVNEYAWKARATALTGRQQNLMGWLYSASSNGTLAFSSLTPGRQFPENAWPFGWENNAGTYTTTVLPFCDTCHMAMDPSTGWPASANSPNRPNQSGFAYTNLASQTLAQTNKGLFGGFMGVNENGFGDRSDLKMPHSQNAFERFWADDSTVGGTCTNTAGARVPKAECLLGPNGMGLWPNGRPAGATFSHTNPLANLVPDGTSSLDCGQAHVVTTGVASNGVNSGRRLAGLVVDGVVVNQCSNGCIANDAFCPGSETSGDASPFPGVRMECQPITQNFGKCVQCGRIYQASCVQVGAGCRSDMNPNCTTQPSCNEGWDDEGFCQDILLSQGKTTSQSSTANGGVSSRAVDGNPDGNFSHNSVTRTNSTGSPAWWRVDLGATKKVIRINIFNRTDCCFDRLSDFFVRYSTDGVVWPVMAGGDFSNVTPTSSGLTSIWLPKAIDARYVQIELRTGQILSLAEVEVWGW
ncbi:MAG TPA: discoidin domain-containing protein [Polyangia bacterium]|jgi:hypothetical protein|nr:discoidin domain-containing protein [Polyangia bacterium]